METPFKLAALSLLSLASVASAASKHETCAATPGAPCYSVDEPVCQYCLGPEQVNPSVRPLTCNGDWTVTIAGLYWNSHQDGMEYAVETGVAFPPAGGVNLAPIQALNNLIDADYKNPGFDWNWGFKLGLGYNSNHDGWDIGVLWTSYQGKASSHNETEADDNRTLVTLWSAFQSYMDSVSYASDIRTKWKVAIDLIDIELGREFWTSKYLTFRPHIGLRIAYINQDFDIEHRGGSWSAVGTAPDQQAYNNSVQLDNDFNGVGVRGGFDTVWNLGRGWSLFGNTALSIVYGKFNVKHDEYNRLASSPHSKTTVLETDDSFRASRFITDLTLGIQWATMFSDCRYGFSIGLAWEQHLYLSQNQMWRVNRIGGSQATLPNNTGENVYHQRRGDLDTQGWTLTVKFAF